MAPNLGGAIAGHNATVNAVNGTSVDKRAFHAMVRMRETMDFRNYLNLLLILKFGGCP